MLSSRLMSFGLLAVLPAATMLAACASSAEPMAANRGWLDGAPPAADARGSDESARRGPLPAAAPLADRSAGAGSAAPPVPGPVRAPSSAVTAGSVDDNERFEDYLAYRATAARAGLHDVEVAGRRVIRVTAGGRPVLGARVVVGGGKALLDARTHSDGRVLFLPKATDGAGDGPWPVTVEAGGAKAEATLAAAGPDLTVTLGSSAGDPVKLDVMFLLDATGSMGDELDRLTANMASTVTKVTATAGSVLPSEPAGSALPSEPAGSALPSEPAGSGAKVRFGLTAFKDRGDDYVTRTFDLTGDADRFREALGQVKAGGGGDTPESVSAGLHEAVTKPAWGGDDVAKVIVLVGDAAPHTDYQDEPSYAADARAAAARGIRLHAIASSGLGDQGEFAFRQMAQLTAGRFVFLTYGADGGPGDTTTHHVDKYSVKSLDDLVATLLVEELRPGRQTQ